MTRVVEPGLYYAKTKKGGNFPHSFIVDAPTRDPEDAKVYHVNPSYNKNEPGFQEEGIYYLEEKLNSNAVDNIFWIENQKEARKRLKRVKEDPNSIYKQPFKAIGNNCQHFANYITTGVHESETENEAIDAVIGLIESFMNWLNDRNYETA